MPDLIAKIGADSTEYRNDMGALPPMTKKAFDQMKTASEGGITDNVKQLKRGFNDLKDLFVGAGIISGVKKFFDVAIAAAEKSKDANDQNANAVLRFSEGLKEVGSIAGTVAKNVVGAFNQIGEIIGQTARETYDYWIHGSQTLTGALGETERAARAQDLALQEMKKHAAEWNSLNAEQKSLIDARVEAERKALPIAEQRAILEKQLLEAQRAQADAADHSLEGKKAYIDQLKIENKLLEAAAQERAAVTKQVAQEMADLEKRHNTALAGLEVSQKQRILKQEISDLEKLIASGALSAADADAQRNILAGRKNELLKSENEEKAKTEDFNKRAALSEDELIERIRLKAKAGKGLTEEEEGRLRVLEMQGQKMSYQAQISDLLAKQIQGTITPAEQETLKWLVAQSDEITKQINLQTDLIAKVKVRAEEEKRAITPMIEYAEAIERATKASHSGGDAGYMKAIGGLRSYNNTADQSSYEQGLVRQASQDIEDEIKSLEAVMQQGQNSGSSTARYERQALQDRVNALRNRQAHVSDYVFKPNYKDAVGQGIFASQVDTLGDPLNLQKKQVSSLDLITQNLADLNTRLRKAGFGT